MPRVIDLDSSNFLSNLLEFFDRGHQAHGITALARILCLVSNSREYLSAREVFDDNASRFLFETKSVINHGNARKGIWVTSLTTGSPFQRFLGRFGLSGWHIEAQWFRQLGDIQCLPSLAGRNPDQHKAPLRCHAELTATTFDFEERLGNVGSVLGILPVRISYVALGIAA